MNSDDTKTKESQRKQVRYAVTDDCRLRATIRLRSSDEASANKEWPGTLVDLSATGAHIQISLAAVAYIGNSCALSLAHGGIKTELRGTLAHYVCSARYSVCGVKFDTFAGGWDKMYQQFFKAIVASATLSVGPAGTESPGRHREEFRGPDHVRLVVWRDKPGGTLLDFDYSMARYGAALTAAGTDMFKNKEQVRFKAAEGGDTGMALSKAQEAEARWEFSLAASNLPKTIAPDIRRFLRLVS
jgi:hypothetical protein